MFWYRFFSIVVNILKSRKVNVFNISNGFKTIKNLSFSDGNFLVSHVSSKPLPEIVFRGSQYQTFKKVGFGCHVRFSRFSKRHLLETIFGRKGSKGAWLQTPGSLLVATLLFTKPWWLLCRWDLVVSTRSFFGWRLAHFLFFYCFPVCLFVT